MKLIHDVLRACGYTEAPVFSLVDPDDLQERGEQRNHWVTPFYSGAASRNAYLVIPVAGSELPYLLEGDFLSSVMLALGQQEFYSPDMDRNTTLLLLCRREEGEKIDDNAKVQIEDDPYYFKKYVFTYTAQEEAAALDYLNRRNGSMLDTIHSCLKNRTLFSEYKEHIAQGGKTADTSSIKNSKGRKKATAKPGDAARRNEESGDHIAYGFFAEVATKITVLPIRPDNSAAITPIEEYWADELQKVSRIDVAALNRLMAIVPDKESDKSKLKADDILARWQELTGFQID